MSDYPSSFFKYISIDPNDLDNSFGFQNTKNKVQIFSRRKSFNDLFDSKIRIKKSSPIELMKFKKTLSVKQQLDYDRTFRNELEKNKLKKFKNLFNKTIDSYLFYCVTINSNNNLMWSHYAKSHKGICIEWDSTEIKADRVSYQDHIPSINFTEFLNMYYHSSTASGDCIWEALRIKLNEWEYEDEYRFQLGNNSTHLIHKDLGQQALVPFEPSWIKSVIFGCRMPEKCRQQIITELPFSDTINFKEAFPRENTLGIKNYKG